jgi:hypothetical protein
MGVGGCPRLDQLPAQLANRHITARLADVDYEFQAGGNRMLVCTHRFETG